MENNRMKHFLVLAFLTFSISSFSHDTVEVLKQKGFLFLTNYNYRYDWVGGESRPLGFHDFFYPIKDFDTKILNDSNIQIVFKNGLRVDFINDRKTLKAKAKLFNCFDSSHCYEFYRFYIIPVEIDYKLYEDNWPFICRRNYYELQVERGSSIRFEYLHKAILLTRIKTASENKNKEW